MIWPFNKKENNIQKETVTLYVKINKGLHVKPEYSGYYGGFTNAVKCRDCGAHALKVDWHTVDPCPNCGGSLNTITAKYDYAKMRWITRDSNSLRAGQNPEEFI